MVRDSREQAKTKLNTKNVENKKFQPAKEKKISAPEAIQVILHDFKWTILKKLMKEDKTIRLLSEELGKNPGTIKRHISDLVKSGLAQHSYIEMNKYGIKLKFYRATALKFVIHLELSDDDELIKDTQKKL